MEKIKTERPLEFDGIERGDCGVHSLAALLAIPYGDARELLAKAGREPRSGTCARTMVAAAQLGGHDLRECPRPRVPGHTSRGFARRVSALRVLDYVSARGHYLVGTSSHWFAVVDGVIYDNGGLRERARLASIYKLTV